MACIIGPITVSQNDTVFHLDDDTGVVVVVVVVVVVMGMRLPASRGPYSTGDTRLSGSLGGRW
jgi:hypothetical protein